MTERIAFILNGVVMTFLILAELTYRAKSQTEAVIAFESDHPGQGNKIKVVKQVPDAEPAQNSAALDLQTVSLERITQQLAQLPAHELELFEQMAQQAARPDRIKKGSEP